MVNKTLIKKWNIESQCDNRISISWSFGPETELCVGSAKMKYMCCPFFNALLVFVSQANLGEQNETFF